MRARPRAAGQGRRPRARHFGLGRRRQGGRRASTALRAARRATVARERPPGAPRSAGRDPRRACVDYREPSSSPRRLRRRPPHGRSRRLDDSTEAAPAPSCGPRASAGATRSGPASRPWSGRRLHFVGIGGAGMSGLALVAGALGAAVTGSDRRRVARTLERAARRRDRAGASATTPRNVPAGGGARLLERDPGGEPRARRRPRARPARAAPRASCSASSARCKRDDRRRRARTARPRRRAMIVHALMRLRHGPGATSSAARSAATARRNAGWGDGGVARGRGRRVRPLAARSSTRRSPCSPTPSSTTTRPTARCATLDGTFREFLAGGRAGAWSGTGPSCSRCATAPSSPFDVADPELDAGGSRFTLDGVDGRARGARRPQRAQRRRRAGGLRARRRRPAARPPRRWRTSRGAGRRFERLGETAAGRRWSSTTTPTTRPRSRRRSPPRARWPAARWSPSSSRTCTRARARWRASSAPRSRAPTSPCVLDDLPGARARRGLPRASAACWSPRRRPTPRGGRRGALAAGLRRRRARAARRAARRRPVPRARARATSTRSGARSSAEPTARLDAQGRRPPARRNHRDAMAGAAASPLPRCWRAPPGARPRPRAPRLAAAPAVRRSLAGWPRCSSRRLAVAARLVARRRRRRDGHRRHGPEAAAGRGARSTSAAHDMTHAARPRGRRCATPSRAFPIVKDLARRTPTSRTACASTSIEHVPVAALVRRRPAGPRRRRRHAPARRRAGATCPSCRCARSPAATRVDRPHRRARRVAVARRGAGGAARARRCARPRPRQAA